MSRHFDQRLGANVRRLRDTAGWSQADLAGRLTARGLSVPQQTINRIEHGERPLKFEEAVTIADLLGLPVAALIPWASEDAYATGARLAAAELRRAKVVKASTAQKIEESVEQLRLEVEIAERRIRDAEEALRGHGAVQDDDGRWHLNGAVIDV